MRIDFSTLKEFLPFLAIIMTITASYISTNINNEIHFNMIDSKVTAIIKSQDHTDGQLDSITLQLNVFRTEQATQELRLTVLEKQVQPLLSQVR